jgi:hypothetical protein
MNKDKITDFRRAYKIKIEPEDRNFREELTGKKKHQCGVDCTPDVLRVVSRGIMRDEWVAFEEVISNSEVSIHQVARDYTGRMAKMGKNYIGILRIFER